MARRGENIYKRKDGRWEGRVPNGFYENGKKRYHSLYAKSYTELKNKLKSYNSITLPDKKVPILYMRELFKIWIDDRQYTWKKSTYACYVHLLQHQIVPELGDILIADFNNIIFSKFIANKKNKTDTPLSDTYIKNITNLVIQAMRYVKEEYRYDISIPSVSPKRENYSSKCLPDPKTMEILKQYLIENVKDSTCLGILLCWHVGLRIGELCALCWKDIDLGNGILHINKTLQRVRLYENNTTTSKVMITIPKTKNSIRMIPIPRTVLQLLKQYRREPEMYIVHGSKHPYAEPRTVQYRFQSILNKCSLPHFNFHMLRHSFATNCIASGFDINSLSEIMGHSSIQVTLNLYVHSNIERKKILMDDFQL